MSLLALHQRAADQLLCMQGQDFTLHVHGRIPVPFRAIKRVRYRNAPGIDAVVVEVSLICRRSIFGTVRPHTPGAEVVDSAARRARVALVQSGEIDDIIEIILEDTLK